MRSGMQRSSPAGLALVMCLAWAVPATARDSGVWQGYREHRGRHHDHHQEGPRRHHDHYRADRWRHHDHYREGRRRHRDHYSGVARTSRGHRDSVYYCAACRQRYFFMVNCGGPWVPFSPELSRRSLPFSAELCPIPCPFFVSEFDYRRHPFSQRTATIRPSCFSLFLIVVVVGIIRRLH